MSGNPVCIRGVHYPSGVAAARALGVHPNAIYAALDRGALDRVGAGRRRSPKPVKVGSVTYPSQVAAAQALGVSAAYVWKLVNAGKPVRRVSRGISVTVGGENASP